MSRFPALPLLVLALLPLGTKNASATLITEFKYTCPYDGEQVAGLSYNAWPQDRQLDGMQIPPVFHGIIDCPQSGFIFFKRDFTPDELERLRPLVESAEFQAMHDEAVAYRALWLRQRFEELTPRDTRSLLLKALWEAWNQPELSLRYAAQLLPLMLEDQRSLSTTGAPNKADDEMLIGELLRRLGRFDEARDHFRTLKPATEIEAAVIAVQMQLIDAQDSGSHRYSEFPGLKDHYP